MVAPTGKERKQQLTPAQRKLQLEVARRERRHRREQATKQRVPSIKVRAALRRSQAEAKEVVADAEAGLVSTNAPQIAAERKEGASEVEQPSVTEPRPKAAAKSIGQASYNKYLQKPKAAAKAIVSASGGAEGGVDVAVREAMSEMLRSVQTELGLSDGWDEGAEESASPHMLAPDPTSGPLSLPDPASSPTLDLIARSSEDVVGAATPPPTQGVRLRCSAGKRKRTFAKRSATSDSEEQEEDEVAAVPDAVDSTHSNDPCLISSGDALNGTALNSDTEDWSSEDDESCDEWELFCPSDEEGDASEDLPY